MWSLFAGAFGHMTENVPFDTTWYGTPGDIYSTNPFNIPHKMHADPLLPPDKPLDYLQQMMAMETAVESNRPIKSLVILVDFRPCGGMGPAFTEDEIVSVMYGTRPDTIPTVEELVNGCSHGQAIFDSNFRKVVTVQMNQCSGTGTSDVDNWSYNNCPRTTYFNRAVEERAAELGIDFSEFDYRWVVLDKGQVNEGCFYAGLATLGCWDEASDRAEPVCRMIVSGDGDYAKDPFVWFHEFGHNLGLLHSSSPLSEYGDITCAMGGFDNFPPASKCYNLPQSMKLGWKHAQYTVNGNSIHNVWKNFTIDAFNSKTRTGLRLKMFKDALFVTYRSPIGPYRFANNKPLDMGIDSNIHLVHIHRFVPVDSGAPMFMTSISPESVYVEPTFNFVIRVGGVSYGTDEVPRIAVSVCRKKQWYHCQ